MMARELQKVQLIERSLIKKYRKELWNPFIACVQRYRLVNEGDSIAVVIDGTLASMLTAKLLQQLQRISDTSFALKIAAYPALTDSAAIENSDLLRLPLITVTAEEAPTAAALLSQLQCNKLAYGTCRSDVVEAVLAAMFYRGTVEGNLPKAPIPNSDGERIMPLYGIDRNAITAWANYNELHLVTAEKPTELVAVAAIVNDLQQVNPDIERNVFQSLHAVCRDTLPGYVQCGEHHRFLERFDAMTEHGKK